MTDKPAYYPDTPCGIVRDPITGRPSPANAKFGLRTNHEKEPSPKVNADPGEEWALAQFMADIRKVTDKWVGHHVHTLSFVNHDGRLRVEIDVGWPEGGFPEPEGKCND